jgi:hypothetical protein
MEEFSLFHIRAIRAIEVGSGNRPAVDGIAIDSIAVCFRMIKIPTSKNYRTRGTID